MKPLFIPAEEQNILINQLTEKYIRRFFSPGKKFIKGPEILHFCDNQQINKFIFFQLHQNWNKYQSGLMHPHYDFAHEEVRKALNSFLSVLSAHIQISEQDFRPFVEKAIFNCISLLLSPEETFDSFYFANKDSVGLVLMERNATHFAYFDFIIQGIILFHQNQHMPLVRKSVFLEKFAKAEDLATKKGQSLETYRRELFRRLADKDLFEIARTADGSIPMPELPPGPNREEGIIPLSESAFQVEEAILEELKESSSQEAPSQFVKEEEKTEQVEEKPEEMTSAPSENLVVEKLENEQVTTTGNISDKQSSPASESSNNLNLENTEKTSAFFIEVETPKMEEVEEEKPQTLADLFQQKTSETQPSNGKRGPISLDNIPIHKQFQFSQKIFLGNNVQFRAFVQEINTTHSWEQADKLLNQKVIQPNNLKEDDSLLQEFIQIVRNRYDTEG
jgi:hypothetical protein